MSGDGPHQEAYQEAYQETKEDALLSLWSLGMVSLRLHQRVYFVVGLLSRRDPSLFGWSWSKVKVVYMRTSFSACWKVVCCLRILKCILPITDQSSL
jgi:hypothetical protein